MAAFLEVDEVAHRVFSYLSCREPWDNPSGRFLEGLYYIRDAFRFATCCRWLHSSIWRWRLEDITSHMAEWERK